MTWGVRLARLTLRLKRVEAGTSHAAPVREPRRDGGLP